MTVERVDTMELFSSMSTNNVFLVGVMSFMPCLDMGLMWTPCDKGVLFSFLKIKVYFGVFELD